MKYRKEIDGLRAVAVLPVILFHAGVKTFDGGYVGVDVFFVISGYLITTILISEFESGTFSFAHFYERRARRILPALFLVMLACIPFAWHLMNPMEFRQFLTSGRAVALFGSNIFFFRHSGYFDLATELNPLLHTWSLAVEEQWYLLFPVFLTLTWRIGLRRILVILALVFLISFSLSQWGSKAYPSAAFYLLPTRIWELLIGAFIAFFLRKPRKPVPLFSEIAGLSGLLLIAYSIYVFDKNTPFPSHYTLAPTLGTGLIILFGTKDTLVGMILSQRLLVGLGLISYSAYLWHQPLLAFAKISGVSHANGFMISMIILGSLFLAVLSWRFVETPFRNRNFFNRKQLFTGALVLSVFFIGLGTVARSMSPREIGQIQNKHYGAYQFDFDLLQKQAGALTDKYTQTDAETRFETNKKKILIIGDSMAGDFITAAMQSKKISDHFELKYLAHDDLCFDASFNSVDCQKRRSEFSTKNNQRLQEQSDHIFIVVGFHPDTKLESFLLDHSQLRKKFVIISSSHFDYFYAFARDVDKIVPFDYDKMAELYARQKLTAIQESNVRAAKIAAQFGVQFYDGYKIYCLEDHFCPLFDKNGNLLVFDTAHKTVAGFEYYSQRLENLFFSEFK